MKQIIILLNLINYKSRIWRVGFIINNVIALQYYFQIILMLL